MRENPHWRMTTRRADIKVIEYFPVENKVTVRLIGAGGRQGKIFTDGKPEPVQLRLAYRTDEADSKGIKEGDYGYVEFFGTSMAKGVVFISNRDHVVDDNAYTYRRVGGELALS